MADDVFFKDLLVYVPSVRKWEDIGAGLDIVNPRMGHGIGFSGGKLYLHGGTRMIPGLILIHLCGKLSFVDQNLPLNLDRKKWTVLLGVHGRACCAHNSQWINVKKTK